MTDHEEEWFHQHHNQHQHQHQQYPSSNNNNNNNTTNSSSEVAVADIDTNNRTPAACFWSSHTADLDRLRPFGPGQGRGKRWGRLKSEAAERRESELKLRFQLAQTHAKALLAQYESSSTVLRTSQLTYQIGKPYDHLTSACYASFRKFVRETCLSGNNNNESDSNNNGNDDHHHHHANPMNSQVLQASSSSSSTGGGQNWTVSRREANAIEKTGHGEKRKGPVYFTVVTYAVPVKYQTAQHPHHYQQKKQIHHPPPKMRASDFLLPSHTHREEEEIVPDLVSPYQEVMSTCPTIAGNALYKHPSSDVVTEEEEEEEDICAKYLLPYHPPYKRIKLEEDDAPTPPPAQDPTHVVSTSSSVANMKVMSSDNNTNPSSTMQNNFVEVAPFTYIFADDNGIGAGYYKRYPSRAASVQSHSLPPGPSVRNFSSQEQEQVPVDCMSMMMSSQPLEPPQFDV